MSSDARGSLVAALACGMGGSLDALTVRGAAAGEAAGSMRGESPERTQPHASRAASAAWARDAAWGRGWHAPEPGQRDALSGFDRKRIVFRTARAALHWKGGPPDARNAAFRPISTTIHASSAAFGRNCAAFRQKQAVLRTESTVFRRKGAALRPASTALRRKSAAHGTENAERRRKSVALGACSAAFGRKSAAFGSGSAARGTWSAALGRKTVTGRT